MECMRGGTEHGNVIRVVPKFGEAVYSLPWNPKMYETRPTKKFKPDPVREAMLGLMQLIS